MTATAYERVTSRLAEVTGYHPGEQGDWRCPAHDDRTASLSVNQGEKGAVLHCHANCSVNAIIEALGLTLADLFDDRTATRESRIVATYGYLDETGALAYEVVRFEPKTFRQRRPDGTGGWVWKMDGVRRVPYRLPELLAGVATGEPIYIAEGEKDVDALHRAGQVATCNPGGAGKWRSEFNTYLEGTRVLIVADKDVAGWEHALQVAGELSGVAAEVSVVEARGAAKDAADHLALGHRAEDLFAVSLEELRKRLEDAGRSSRTAADSEAVTPAQVPPARRPTEDPCCDREPEWPTLAPEALYGLAGEIVTTLEPFTESDPAAMLLTLLGAFGNALGAGPHALADAARHPSRLFVCVVGQTAKARKGTSWRNIAQVLRIADEEWMQRRVKSGLSSGEGLIAAVADPVTDDKGSTVSAGSRDRRLLVIEEEFARMLQVAKREASTLSAIVREAYDTGNLMVLTKTAQTATGAHISIVGHVTLEELRARLSETDMANGLANRFLFVCARRSKLLPHPRQVDQATLNGLGASVGRALRNARPLGQVTFSEEAASLWADLYQEMADDDPGGLLGAIVARPETQTLRLALTYALLDESSQIASEHLQAAWAVWSYCRQSAAYIFGDAIGDERADKLLRAIRQAGPAGLDGTAQSDLFSRNLTARQVQALRDRLGDRIWTIHETDTGGRPRLVSYDRRHRPATES